MVKNFKEDSNDEEKFVRTMECIFRSCKNDLDLAFKNLRIHDYELFLKLRSVENGLKSAEDAIKKRIKSIEMKKKPSQHKDIEASNLSKRVYRALKMSRKDEETDEFDSINPISFDIKENDLREKFNRILVISSKPSIDEIPKDEDKEEGFLSSLFWSSSIFQDSEFISKDKNGINDYIDSFNISKLINQAKEIQQNKQLVCYFSNKEESPKNQNNSIDDEILVCFFWNKSGYKNDFQFASWGHEYHTEWMRKKIPETIYNLRTRVNIFLWIWFI